MDLSVFSTAVQNALGANLPNLLGAVVILIVGYVLAIAVRAVTRKLLAYFKINTRMSDSTGTPFDIEGGIALAGFWFVLLVTIIGIFNTLNLEQLSAPFAQLMSQITTYLPHLLAGGLLLLVAWVAATLVRVVVNRALKTTRWNEKLTAQAGMQPMGESVGNILFWVVILIFMPAILGAFQIDGLLDPVRAMVNKTLAMLPNILASIVIIAAGWAVARILKGLVVKLLVAAGADSLGKKAGLQDKLELSSLIGVLVFILVFVPALIAALDALAISSISGPATEMLGIMMMTIPSIFTALLILFVTWYVARFAAVLLGNLLVGAGADAVPAKIGLAHLFTNELKISALVPRIMVFFAMLFATVEAAHRLDFSKVEELVSMFIQFGSDVLLGVAILTIGFWLATLAHQAIIRSSEGEAVGVAGITRYAILGIILAMGLSVMGISDEIVQLAFALVFGAVAVAVALSFGLGGRDAAGKQMEYWLAKLRKEKRD